MNLNTVPATHKRGGLVSDLISSLLSHYYHLLRLIFDFYFYRRLCRYPSDSFSPIRSLFIIPFFFFTKETIFHDYYTLLRCHFMIDPRVCQH